MRATGAQVLGVLLDHVEATQVQEVVRLLMVLAQQAEWEVRHASLLGIQHMLAVRQVPIISHHLTLLLSVCYTGGLCYTVANGDSCYFEWVKRPK